MAPFAPGTLDSTYCPGVDAVRIRVHMVIVNEISFQLFLLKTYAFVLVPTENFKGNYDYESVIGRIYERNSLGFGFEGSKGRLGQWAS